MKNHLKYVIAGSFALASQGCFHFGVGTGIASSPVGIQSMVTGTVGVSIMPVATFLSAGAGHRSAVIEYSIEAMWPFDRLALRGGLLGRGHIDYLSPQYNVGFFGVTLSAGVGLTQATPSPRFLNSLRVNTSTLFLTTDLGYAGSPIGSGFGASLKLGLLFTIF